MLAEPRHNWGIREEEFAPWSSQAGKNLTPGPGISEILGS